MATTYKVRGVYSFEVYPPRLGNLFQNVTVMAELDFDSANQEIDVQAMHADFRASVPDIPADPRDYNYLKLRMPSGQITVIGIPWINDATVQEVTSNTIVAEISGGVTTADIPRIIAALGQNGYRTVKVTMK